MTCIHPLYIFYTQISKRPTALRCSSPIPPLRIVRLPNATRLSEVKSVTSNANNSVLNILAAEQLILVRNASKSASRRAVLAGAEVVVLCDGVAVLLGEARGQGVLDADEDVALDERLGAHAGVDGRVAVGVAVEVRVDDVGGAEAEQGLARVDVLPVVVGVGDVQLALVLVAVAVAVADQGGLEVVVEVGVAGEILVSFMSLVSTNFSL